MYASNGLLGKGLLSIIMGSTLMKLLSETTGNLDALYIPIITILGVMMIFDAITGTLRTVINGQKLDKHIAFVGMLKKVLEVILMAFGCLLDIFGVWLVNRVDFLPSNLSMPFGTIIGVYLIITEAISILSNIQKSDNTLLPKWFLSLFKNAKKSIDDMGDEKKK